MSWLRIDDVFAEHPKVIDLSDRAFRLHVAALCFCARNLTDGVLVDRSVKVVCALTSATKKHVTELVDAGLWLKGDGGGFAINDYLKLNPKAEKVKADRDAARDRMARVRAERSAERSPTPDPDPSPSHVPKLDQKPKVDPPEQTRATDVAALVEESLRTGSPDAVRALVPACDVGVLLELLPAKEIAANTRDVLAKKFAQLPPHFISLAREELLAAGDAPRSRIRYLNGIADRMIADLGRRATAAQEHERWVDEHHDDPDAHAVIETFAADAFERQALHERLDEHARGQAAAAA